MGVKRGVRCTVLFYSIQEYTSGLMNGPSLVPHVLRVGLLFYGGQRRWAPPLHDLPFSNISSMVPTAMCVHPIDQPTTPVQ